MFLFFRWGSSGNLSYICLVKWLSERRLFNPGNIRKPTGSGAWKMFAVQMLLTNFHKCNICQLLTSIWNSSSPFGYKWTLTSWAFGQTVVRVVMFAIQISKKENSGVVSSWQEPGHQAHIYLGNKSVTLAGSVKDTGRQLQTSSNRCSGSWASCCGWLWECRRSSRWSYCL